MKTTMGNAKFSVEWSNLAGDERKAEWEGDSNAPPAGTLTLLLDSFEEAQAVLALIEKAAPGRVDGRKNRKPRAVAKVPVVPK